MKLFRQRPVTVEVEEFPDGDVVKVRYGKDRYLYMTRGDFAALFEPLVPIND